MTVSRSRRARRHGAVIGTAAAVSLSLGACTTPDRATPPPPDTGPPAATYRLTAADAAEIRTLMRSRAEAVLTGDREGFVATIDDADVDLAAQQAEIFDNLRELPLTDLSYVVGTSTGSPERVAGGDPLAAPRVVEHLSMRGVLEASLATRQPITFVRRDGAWVVARAVAPRSPVAPPWTGGPIDVEASPGLLVVTDEGARPGAAVAAEQVASDLARVAGDLGLPDDTALVVDATSNGEPLLLSDTSRIEARAVTYPLPSEDDESPRPGRAGTGIKINPERVTEILRDRVTMRHELAHVLLPEDEAIPIWMSEGLAEYVGTLPVTVAEDRAGGSARRIDLSERRRVLVDDARWGDDPPGDYLIARAGVEYLVERGGVDRFLKLLDAVVATGGPDTGEVTGDPPTAPFVGCTASGAGRSHELRSHGSTGRVDRGSARWTRAPVDQVAAARTGSRHAPS